MIRPAAAIGMVALLMTSCARADCFVDGTQLPERESVLAAVDHGQGGREIMDAVFKGDEEAAHRLLAGDPQLVRTSDRKSWDLLTVAIARCDRGMVDLLLQAGAPPDGPNLEAPLTLAIRATTPWFAERLLQAGAKADPGLKDAMSPLMEALMLRSRGGVRLLLDHGAAVDPLDSIGNSPLQTALGLGEFAIAEVLLDHGADPFAADVSGSTPANSVVDFDDSAEDAAAKPRVLAKLKALGALPAIPPEEVRRRVMAGRWPPEGAEGGPPSAQVVETMRANWNPDGTKRGR